MSKNSVDLSRCTYTKGKSEKLSLAEVKAAIELLRKHEKKPVFRLANQFPFFGFYYEATRVNNRINWPIFAATS